MPNPLALDGFIAARAFNTPLLLEEGKARVICNYLHQRFRLKGTFAPEGMLSPDYLTRTKEGNPPAKDLEGVAIVPIVGTLVHRAGDMDADSGLVSYQTLRAELITLANDDSIKTIVLDVDSGGGEVDGCFELAALIREINDTMKPVISIANGHAYSAAYALACAAGHMFMTSTGGVGSIGVITQHVDFSKANDLEGIRITNIKAGARKDQFSADFPLSDEAKQLLQDKVNMTYDIFTQHVADMRNITVKAVQSTEAGLIFGQEAISIKLVDGILSFDDLVEGLVNTDFSVGLSEANKRIETMSFLKNKSKEKASTPAPDEKDPAAPAADPAPAEGDDDEIEGEPEAAANADPVERAAVITELCASAGMSAQAPRLIRSSMTVEQVRNDMAKAGEIKQACKLAGKPDRADGFIQSGKSLKVVQAELLAEIEEAQKASAASPIISPEKAKEDLDGARDYMAEDIKRREDANKKPK